ncbi:hypothetical protein [Actinomadura sp. HBU206391]|uniref:hypothetical protein n=1 Tax=Actinomadura sp. HBU206391 TaxID=2731692 RepID=UPI00164F268B|nr:hypothetical protein [Actinomadura sp. HBU206391]
MECEWYSRDSLLSRVLQVRIFAYRPPVGSAMSQAMEHIAGRPLGDSVPTPKPVSGLGEEANLVYPNDKGAVYEGALVRFRVSNAVVEARFGGSDDGGPNGDAPPISQQVAVKGAFRAAAETAKAMKTQARPRLAPAVKTAAPPAVRPPCALVSKQTLAKVTKGAGGEKITLPEPLTLTPGTHESDPPPPRQTCQWRASTPPDDTGATYRRQLQVTTFAFPSVAAAQRNFLINHYVLRDQSGADFRVLASLGDQAVAGFDKDNKFALASFQRGHVVVAVTYAGNDKRVPIPKNQATNAAYTAALDVAATLTP